MDLLLSIRSHTVNQQERIYNSPETFSKAHTNKAI
jgi:hypothetical protein